MPEQTRRLLRQFFCTLLPNKKLINSDLSAGFVCAAKYPPFKGERWRSHQGGCVQAVSYEFLVKNFHVISFMHSLFRFASLREAVLSYLAKKVPKEGDVGEALSYVYRYPFRFVHRIST